MTTTSDLEPLFAKRNPQLQNMLDTLADATGVERQSSAIPALRCAFCKQDVSQKIRTWSEIDQREFFISGMCVDCWNAMAADIEEDEDDC